jgi:hypothetical protein
MDRPDTPQDEKPGTTNVPALIHDYRAQRDAWREQARNLARMREEVLAAADREARDIVSTARADVRRILLKARRDLLVLAAQVRAAGRIGDTDDTPETVNLLPRDDLGNVGNALTTARHDVRRVLDESRPELEGLASEGEALRAALRQHSPTPPVLEARRRNASSVMQSPYSVPGDDAFAEQPVDFEFSTIPSEEGSDFTVTHARRPARALLAAAATIGGLALMGTGWWLFGPSSEPAAAKPVAANVSRESTSSATTAKGSPSTAVSRSAATAPTTERRSPIPEGRGPLSIRLATRGSSWIRLTADGRVVSERLFKAGETQQIRASREISVRAGDAGAVTVAVDGRPPVALGREGEVVTRRFEVQGARAQQAPAPTATTARPEVPVAQRPAPTPTALSAAPSNTQAVRVTESPATAPSLGSTPPPSVSSSARPAVPPTISQPPQAAPAAATPVRPPSPTTAAPAVSLQDTLTNVTSRWHDAYYRQDRATMASISPQVNVADDRAERERLPRGLPAVRRSLDDVKFQQVSDDTAMLTARMTERMDDASAGKMATAVSLVSHIYMRKNGSWQLFDVRIVSASTLGKALGRN